MKGPEDCYATTNNMFPTNRPEKVGITITYKWEHDARACNPTIKLHHTINH
jgi:hypothetical protein